MLWRLEGLINDPESSLREVCTFLEIEYDAKLLDYHLTPVNWGEGRDTSTHGLLRETQVNAPIRDTRGRWKTDLPREYLAKLREGEAMRVSEALGYRLAAAF